VNRGKCRCLCQAHLLYAFAHPLIFCTVVQHGGADESGSTERR
jgi:hypothetical protein